MEVLDEKINENLIGNITDVTVSDVEKLMEERPGRFHLIVSLTDMNPAQLGQIVLELK